MNNINEQIANIFETFKINNKVKKILDSLFVIGLFDCGNIYRSVNLSYKIGSNHYDTELLGNRFIFLINKDIFDNLNPYKIDNKIYDDHIEYNVIDKLKKIIINIG